MVSNLVVPAYGGLIFVLLLYVFYRLRVYQLKQRQKELEALVEERGNKLQASMESLYETRQLLAEQEKQAALARLVRGVAHELNTPIGIVKMAYSMVSQSYFKLIDDLKARRLNEEQLDRSAKKVVGSHEMMEKNLDRVVGLIDGFKKLAVDEADQKVSRIFLGGFLQDIIDSYDVDVKWCLDIDASLVIETFSVSFKNVVTELIENACHHARPENEQLTISISAVAQQNNIEIYFADNGQLAAEVEADKVFDPFYTASNKQERVGLGLHFVYNLVTQLLEGKIEFDATKGTCIKIILPATINTEMAKPEA